MVSATQIALLGGALIAAGAVAKYTGAGVGLGELAEGSRKLVAAPLSGTAQGITEVSGAIGGAAKGIADAIRATTEAVGGATACLADPVKCIQRNTGTTDDRVGARPIPIAPVPVTPSPPIYTPYFAVDTRDGARSQPSQDILSLRANSLPYQEGNMLRVSQLALSREQAACPTCTTEQLFTRAGQRPITQAEINSGLIGVY